MTTSTRHLTNKESYTDTHPGEGEKHGPKRYGMYGSDLQGYGNVDDDFIDDDHEHYELEGPGSRPEQPSKAHSEHMKGAGGEEQKAGEDEPMKGDGSKDKKGEDMKSTADKPMKGDGGADTKNGNLKDMKGGESDGDSDGDGEKQASPRPRSSGASDDKPGKAASDDSESDKDGPGGKLDASAGDKAGGEKYAGDDEIEAPGPAPRELQGDIDQYRPRSRRALFAANSDDSTHAHEHDGKNANDHDHDDEMVGQAPRAVPRAQGTRGKQDHDSEAPGPAPSSRGASCGGNRNGTNSDEGQGMRNVMGGMGMAPQPASSSDGPSKGANGTDSDGDEKMRGDMGGMHMAPRAAPNSHDAPQSGNSTDSDDIMCDDMEEMFDMAPRAGPRTQATKGTAQSDDGMLGDGGQGGVQAARGNPGSPTPRRALAGYHSHKRANADTGSKQKDSTHEASRPAPRSHETTSDETAKGDGKKGGADGEENAAAPRLARPPLDGDVKYKGEEDE